MTNLSHQVKRSVERGDPIIGKIYAILVSSIRGMCLHRKEDLGFGNVGTNRHRDELLHISTSYRSNAFFMNGLLKILRKFV